MRFCSISDFNPRAPQGARLARFFVEPIPDPFQSTRSARSAANTIVAAPSPRPFQSTRSARSATDVVDVLHAFTWISIHALRKERDSGSLSLRTTTQYFNPRAPQGARLVLSSGLCVLKQFQSTRSARSATNPEHPASKGYYISIHALRKERDRPQSKATYPAYVFQSTRSARSATAIRQTLISIKRFQSTRSARSATTAF